MDYPDGTLMRCGDLIWWNECLWLGYVQHIAEKQEEFEAWGLDSPHAFFANYHPFDPTQTGIAYSPHCFHDEVISKPTQQELNEFLEASAFATGQSNRDLENSTFTAEVRCENGRRIEWVFSYIEIGRVVEVVAVPINKKPNKTQMATPRKACD